MWKAEPCATTAIGIDVVILGLDERLTVAPDQSLLDPLAGFSCWLHLLQRVRLNIGPSPTPASVGLTLLSMSYAL
jgi:hypothetical protein